MGDNFGRRFKRFGADIPTLVMVVGPYRLAQRIKKRLYNNDWVFEPIPDVFVDYDGSDISPMQAQEVAARLGYRMRFEEQGIYD